MSIHLAARARRQSVRVASTYSAEKLESRRLLTAISWDGGGDGTNWSDALNWSGDVVPGFGDDVTINVAGSPTILLNDNRNVHSLANAETLAIHAPVNGFANLTLDAASTNTGTIDFDVPSDGGYNANLALSGATLTSSGTIRSTAVGVSYGSISGGGTLANAAGGSIQVNTATLRLSGVTFTQQASISVAAGAQFEVSNSIFNYLGGSNSTGVVERDSTLNFVNAAFPSIVVANGSSSALVGIGSANFQLTVRGNPFESTYVNVPNNAINAGTILFDVPTAGGYTSGLIMFAGATLTNNGTIRSTAATSSFGQITGQGVATLAALVNNGTIDVQSRDLQINGLTFTQHGSLTSSGDGRLVANNDAVIYTGGSNGSEFHVRGGTIDLRAASAASTVIADAGGGTFIQNLAPNLTLEIRTADFQPASLSMYASGTNAGTILFTVLTPGGYTSALIINDSASLINNGTIRVAAPNSASDIRQIYTNNTGTLVNNGTIDVLGGDLSVNGVTLEQHGSMTFSAGGQIINFNNTLKYLGGSNGDGLIVRGNVILNLQAAAAPSTIAAESTNTFAGNASANLTVNLRSSNAAGGSLLYVPVDAVNAGTILFGVGTLAGYSNAIGLQNGAKLTNNGTIRVANGVNVNDPRQIAGPGGNATERLVNNGTIDLIGGDLLLYSLALEQHAAIAIAAGRRLELSSGSLQYLGGSNSGNFAAINSKLDLQTATAASTVRAEGGGNNFIGNATANLTILVAASATYGTASLGVLQNATNSGTITLDAGTIGYTAQVSVADSVTLNNQGTIRSVTASPSPFTSYANIYGTNSVTRGTLLNSGTLDATAGGLGVANIDFKQQGSMHIGGGNKLFFYSGKLSYLGGSNDPGFFVSGASLDLQAAAAPVTISAIGGGNIYLGSATPRFTVSIESNTSYGSGQIVVNTPAINHGTILLTPADIGYSSQIQVNNGGAFTNAVDGVVKTAGGVNASRYFTIATGDQVVATFNNLGLIALDGQGSIYGSGPVTNNGTIRVTADGLASFNPDLINNSLVDVVSGTMRFYGNTNVDDGAFLSGGHYHIASGATLGFGTSAFSSPSINTADFDVTGSGVLEFAQMTTNRGRIGLADGADFATTPPTGVFTLEGIIDLSSTSVFAISGDLKLAGGSQPVVRTEIASLANFGTVTITGSINLNSPDSTSRFDPDLVGAFDPALGSVFNVITATGTITNAFDSFQGGLTPSGRIMTLQRPSASIVAVRIDPGPLPPAPQIISQTYDYLVRQAVVFQFNQDVSAFLSRKDYQILNVTTGQTLSQSAGTLTFNSASNLATLVLTNQLPDGDYRLTVNASDIANAAGVPASGSPIILKFFSLAGDANHDRKVDFADLVLLAQNYNLTGRTSAQGNFNYSPDGAVDFADLVILAQQYNKNLGVAPPVMAPAPTRDAEVRPGKGRVSADVLQ